ncbi:MAG: hypothetical protein ACKPKO_01560, partial [Candidatus Fonsibacter sp.]
QDRQGGTCNLVRVIVPGVPEDFIFGIDQVRHIQELARQYSPGRHTKGTKPSLTWSTTGTSTVCKVMCSFTVLAKVALVGLGGLECEAIWTLGLH